RRSHPRRRGHHPGRTRGSAVAQGRLKRGWALLGGLVTAALLWVVVPRLGRKLEFFRIHRIEVRGLVSLTAPSVIRALKVPPRASVFDDLTPIAHRASNIPGVTSAEVARRLPGTLVVTVYETAPVALVPRDSGMALVSEDGRVLPFDPTVAAPDLPVIRNADSLVTHVLARIRETDATLFGGIASGWRSEGDVIIQVNNQRYRFRPDASAEVIRAVIAVAQDLSRK